MAMNDGLGPSLANAMLGSSAVLRIPEVWPHIGDIVRGQHDCCTGRARPRGSEAQEGCRTEHWACGRLTGLPRRSRRWRPTASAITRCRCHLTQAQPIAAASKRIPARAV